MSRIPVPTHSYTTSSHSERAASPTPSSNSRTLPNMSTLSGSAMDTRRKASKKDEVRLGNLTMFPWSLCSHCPSFNQAIRKKIESELARKRTISTAASNSLRNKKLSKMTGAKGTVAALKPSPALTVPESMTVADASQLCAAKRTDCVLVVDDEEGLSGIFTAKDLAFRVSGPLTIFGTA